MNNSLELSPWNDTQPPYVTAKVIPQKCTLTLEDMSNEVSRILMSDMNVQITYVTEAENKYQTKDHLSKIFYLANDQQIYLEAPFEESENLFGTYTNTFYSAQIKITGGPFPSTAYLPVLQIGDITTAIHMHVYSAACLAAIEEERQQLEYSKQVMAIAAGESFQRDYMPLAHQVISNAFDQMHTSYAQQQPFCGGSTKRDRDGNPLSKESNILDTTHRENLFAQCIKEALLSRINL